MKKVLMTILSLSMVASLSACTKDSDTSATYKPGTYNSVQKGFGGDITVNITFDDSSMTEVIIEGNQETQGYGSNAVEQLPDLILKAQSGDVDSISGATVSSDAIIAGVNDCLAQAKGEETSVIEVKMKPGEYRAYAESYRAKDGLNVTVTVDETSILDIKVDTENTSDTPTILQSAIDNMIPRMIEHQSLTIDSICGATISSNAIKAAATDAVKQALEAAGTDASAIKNFDVTLPQSNETVTLDTEVLVVGMGGSGTMAAMSAVEEGAKVIAIDKAGKYGGTTSITSEGLFVNPPKFQEENNNGEDFTDAELMYNNWVEYDEGDGKEEIIRKMIDRSGEVLDWLVYDHDFKFAMPQTGFTPSDIYLTKYQWLPNDIMYNKTEIGKYFDGMYEDFTELGGEYLLETEGYELIYDKSTNTVTGVKARDLANGKEYIINAKRIILATGGYIGNPQMQLEILEEEYFPIKGEWKVLGSMQNDGKMFASALEIGAGMYNKNMAPEVHNSGTETWLTTQFDAHYIDGAVGEVLGRPAFWTEGDLPANLGWAADSLAVDKNGNRFTAETGVSFLDPWIAGPNYYSIYSQTQIDNIAENGFDVDRSGPSQAFLGSGHQIPMNTPVPNVDKVLEAAIEAGIMFKANTVEDLATQLGMDPTTLATTVETYNTYCQNGVDEQFNKDASLLDEVNGGPYYAVKMASYAYGTCGGLDINENFEVLQTDGETPIEGLYAIGTDSMGVLFTEKKPYVTYGGANNGWSMTSGYLVGKEVAQDLGY